MIFSALFPLILAIVAACTEVATLPMTLDLEEVDGRNIPVQSGRPMISFESQERPTLDLGGPWKKLRLGVDHDFSMKPRTPQWLTDVEAETGGATRPGFDDSAWDDHVLPGVENIMPDEPEDPIGAEVYEGGVYYRRHAAVPAEWEGRVVRLVTLSADYVADVWVNGEWVGYHEGGYTPFAFDVSSKLVYGGDNLFAYRIDAVPWEIRLDTLPFHPTSDWQHYGGIVQDVYLEATPPIHVVRADVLPENRAGKLDVSVVVENRGLSTETITAAVRVFTLDPDHPGYQSDPVAAHLSGDPVFLSGNVETSLTLASGAYTRLGFDVSIPDPLLWTPAEPNLYVLEATLYAGRDELDSFSTQFGIRTIEVGPGAKVLLNGSPVFFTGMARHEDWPDTGRTADMDRIAEDLQIIRDTNVWFLRTAHYPNHPWTYILTDRMGFAVWEEIPAWWLTRFSVDVLMDRGLHKQMWREMIWNDRNRPSVLFWSLCNEPKWFFTSKLREYIRDLHSDLDDNYPDGRLVSQSLAADGEAFTASAQQDVDVAGWTLYFGVFYGDCIPAETAAFVQRQWDRFPDQPILATEFGYWSGSDGSSEPYQVQVAGETLDGLFPFAAVDPEGNTTAGPLSGVTWWCQFNWYRIQEPHNQTMGLLHMDRVISKPVHSTLVERYRPYFDMGGLGEPVGDSMGTRCSR